MIFAFFSLTLFLHTVFFFFYCIRKKKDHLCVEKVSNQKKGENHFSFSPTSPNIKKKQTELCVRQFSLNSNSKTETEAAFCFFGLFFKMKTKSPIKNFWGAVPVFVWSFIKSGSRYIFPGVFFFNFLLVSEKGSLQRHSDRSSEKDYSGVNKRNVLCF